MILSFVIGVVLRFLNLIFSLFPVISNLTDGINSAVIYLVQVSMPWNFILPISNTLGLIVKFIQFEFGILLLLAGKYIVELIRGK